MKKIILLSTSPFPYGNNITDGPGYRAWHLFRALAYKHDVTILSLYESYHLGAVNEFELSEDNIRIKGVRHKPSRIAKLIEEENPDVLYLPWSSTPFLSRLKQKIPTIIDYIGAGLLEEYATKGRIPVTLLQVKVRSFWLGDFFMTAGQRERYYLLGLLASSKKLSYGQHNRTDPLIHFIPMTPPSTPPRLKEKLIDKKPDDFILLVAGAFLPWYDYKTFFQALGILEKKGKRGIKVVFMGANPKGKKHETIVRRMGYHSTLENITYTGMVPFKQRDNYYLLADAAVNIPSNTIEDELSVRTRVVDYLWANLPIVTPAKDEYSAAAVKSGAGFVYETGNAYSLARIIESLMDEPDKLKKARSKAQTLLEHEFNLKNHVSKLEAFIENPYVNPVRLSPSGVGSDLFLWFRDILNLLKS
jgi:glycosyltransferase involved in cell wall biosynthesis